MIRFAKKTDVAEILRIYSSYVKNSVATFEEEAPSLAEMQSRFEKITLEDKLPFLVCEENGAVRGYAYAYKYHQRSAYRFTVENSVYIDEAGHGKGYGKLLMLELISELKKVGIKNIISRIATNDSVAFHKKLGFVEVGTLKNVGLKFNKWLDTTLMQLEI